MENRNRNPVRTLVSSWAFARLSTAIAKKTFRSVSLGEQLRKNYLHTADVVTCSPSAATTLLSPLTASGILRIEPLTRLCSRAGTGLPLPQQVSLVRVHTRALQRYRFDQYGTSMGVLETQQPAFALQKIQTDTPARTHTEDSPSVSPLV